MASTGIPQENIMNKKELHVAVQSYTFPLTCAQNVDKIMSRVPWTACWSEFPIVRYENVINIQMS